MSNPFIFGPPPPPPKSSSSGSNSASQQQWSSNRGGSGRGGRGGGRGSSASFSHRGRGRGGGGGYGGIGGANYRGSHHTSRESRPEVSPAVPAFGNLSSFGHPSLSKPASTGLSKSGNPANRAQNVIPSLANVEDPMLNRHPISPPKPTTNLLGLTPALDPPDALSSSDSEDSIDEEAEAARFNNPLLTLPTIPVFPASGVSTALPDVHVFSFRGTTLDLRSPEAVSAWIASRRANFPTKEKIEAKAALKAARDEERKKELEERQRKRKEEREEENKRRRLEKQALEKDGGSTSNARKRIAPQRQRLPPSHRKSLYQRMRENDLEHENRTLVSLIRALGDQGHLD